MDSSRRLICGSVMDSCGGIIQIEQIYCSPKSLEAL